VRRKDRSRSEMCLFSRTRRRGADVISLTTESLSFNYRNSRARIPFGPGEKCARSPPPLGIPDGGGCLRIR
jgi:hypothetical protein